ncbi:UDP-N-acetylmuramoyl-L-alanine--D-glutamate ligase [Acidobacteria bacterium ACD]|nr:MAG: UDP-N-acetylmuramoyl-L-alanine--D-glutamate ligase [Acidobacteriota bacterium]MCE7959087.1 UDP-N-acetylmuramoyl-L-alanine--D-glutamate ligase [Acidobacteria bacterium ACB2]MDL1950272.1 UDP-N-acetylmuramoyl-L-alanine--D-glutamate ligase [Acidobacteria bacterium ACD]
MSLSLGPDLPDVSRAAVLGLARSGRATIEALLSRGVAVSASDTKGEGEIEPVPPREGLVLALGGHPDAHLDGVQLVVVSPGVPMTAPFLDGARARGIPVVSEVELASRLLPGLVVGITGTNGKSTTTALAAALLCDAGLSAVACGNFGTPWISYAAAGGETVPSRVWVVELSSYQLEGTRRFAPDVAVHLNLTPDHLDRYRSLDDYGAAKARIFENQREAQVAVLNADDPLVARVFTRARRLEFSRKGPREAGAWTEGDLFVAALPGKPAQALGTRADLSLPGAHNVENALAALAATLPLGVTPASVKRTFGSFRGLPHRTQLVRTLAGVSWYDDSKGTNVDATLKSVEGFGDGRVLLILGGKDKGDDFRRLLPLVARKARKVLAIGAAGDAIVHALSADVDTVWVGTLERAVEEAHAIAREGDAVLLSPACASFDQFRNFEHRGEVFASLVAALPDGEGG